MPHDMQTTSPAPLSSTPDAARRESRMATKVRRLAPLCPQTDRHTPEPESYVAWHLWADTMGKTHHQIQCVGCGLWAVWVPGAENPPAERRAEEADR